MVEPSNVQDVAQRGRSRRANGAVAVMMVVRLLMRTMVPTTVCRPCPRRPPSPHRSRASVASSWRFRRHRLNMCRRVGLRQVRSRRRAFPLLRLHASCNVGQPAVADLAFTQAAIAPARQSAHRLPQVQDVLRTRRCAGDRPRCRPVPAGTGPGWPVRREVRHLEVRRAPRHRRSASCCVGLTPGSSGSRQQPTMRLMGVGQCGRRPSRSSAPAVRRCAPSRWLKCSCTSTPGRCAVLLLGSLRFAQWCSCLARAPTQRPPAALLGSIST